MMLRAVVVLLALSTTLALVQAQLNPKQLLQFSAEQLQATAKQVNSSSLFPTAAAAPNSSGYSPWALVGSGDWTCGFFASSLWQLYNLTGLETWKTLATTWTLGIQKQENNTGTHDVGFMVYYSFGRGYLLTGNSTWKAVVLQTAASLSTRYSKIVGCIRSWSGYHFPVIVDNMLNLELLFWAAQNGGPQVYYDMAVNHSDHTMKYHIRPAGNSWHLVDYDPNTGAVLGQYNTPQGLNSTNGTWARGQGWAIYGFTMAYRYTKLPRYLATAQLCADWYIAHVPSDYVPYWDFDVPAGSPRDSSAASITASGLLELARYVDKDASKQYLEVATKILTSLASSSYLADPLKTDAILLHGVASYPDNAYINRSLIYGDYYFIEALLRYMEWNM